MDFKVLTINTWKGDGRYSQRLGLLAEQIAKLQPNLVLMQEALQTLDRQFDTACYLAKELGMHSEFVPARKKERSIDGLHLESYSGLAGLSTYPFLFSEALVLPSNEADGGRKAQIMGIQVEKRNVWVANVHLSFLKNSESLKIAQLETVLIRLAMADSANFFLMGGDFNSTPDSATMKYVKHQEHFTARDTLGPYLGEAKPTNPNDLETMPGTGKRIDYLFSLSRTHAPPMDITHSEIVLNTKHASGIYPSDHFGVFTHFQMNL